MCSIYTLFSFDEDEDNNRYEVTSEVTAIYNSIAWSNGDNKRRWDPMVVLGGYYWPKNIPNESTLNALMKLYGKMGYERIDSGLRQYEPGFEKVAIYTYSETFQVSHVARQISDECVRNYPRWDESLKGQWTSKLFDREDIRHSDLEYIQGKSFGYVAELMRRSSISLLA
jgi:hypothetical protein